MLLSGSKGTKKVTDLQWILTIYLL